MAELREIIEGCKRKERRYQDELYTKYSSMLFGLCLRYTKSREEAEDVLQEGMVKIFKNVASYSMTNSFEGWMRRIVINTAITHYRKNLKHAYQDDVTEMSQSKFSNQDNYDSDFTKEELLGDIIGLLQSPAKNVISALQSGGQTLSGIVKTLSER